MAGEAKVEDVLNFKIGQRGLDLVSAPVGKDPESLEEAVNVEYKRDQGLNGLASRGSLVPLNSEALGGAIMALAAVPLPSPVDDITFDVLYLMTTDGYLRSTNGGTSWSPFTFTDVPDLVLLPWNPSLLTFIDDPPEDPPLAYYPKDNGDGTTDIIGVDLTDNTPTVVTTVDGKVSGLVGFDGKLYIAINSDEDFELSGSSAQVSPVLSSRVEVYTPGNPTTVQIGSDFGGYNVEDDGTPRDSLGTTQVNPNYTTAYDFGGYSRNGSAIAAIKVTNDRVYVSVGALVTGNSAFDDNFICGTGTVLPPPRPHRSGNAATSVYSIGIGETEWTLESADSAVLYQGGPAGIAALFGTGIYGGAGGTDASGEGYFDDTAPDNCNPLPNTDGTGKAPDPATIGRVALSRWDATPGGFAGVGKTLLVDDLNDGYAYFGPGIVFDGKLFVCYVSAPSLDAGATAIRIYRLDADDAVNFPCPDWAIDVEIIGTFGGSMKPGVPFVVDNALFWPFASTSPTSGYICKRTTGGIWSKPTTGLDITGPGISAQVPL
jgi:hypothetical protein